jgi:hypothetical protein
MPINLPVMPVQQTFQPNIQAPKDLTGLISAFQDDYASSYAKAKGMENQRIVGNSGANAQAAQNRAVYEKAQQDTVDQTGKPGAAPTTGKDFDWSLFTDEELIDILNFSK